MYLSEVGNGSTFDEDEKNGCQFDWSKESIEIVRGFMIINNLQTMTLI